MSNENPRSQHTVALVLDPNFEARLEELSRRVHVWIAESAENTPTAHMLWEKYPGHSLEQGVTTFKRGNSTPEEAAARMIDTIELHHGVVSRDPPVDRIEVFGAEPAAPVVAALQEIGFTVVTRSQNGFVAEKRWLTSI